MSCKLQCRMPAGVISRFVDQSAEPRVDGFLHEPSSAFKGSLVLTHGAGANCQSKLLVSVAEAVAEAGLLVLRCNLPFRQLRPHGPPAPGSAERDQLGLRRAVDMLKMRTAQPVFLGGHSYGGRQASMLAADEPALAAGLLLLSYPLHPPRRPEQMRTAHFPRLTTPALFVHGARDTFGSLQELGDAIAQIPAPHQILEIQGAGHELLNAKNQATLASDIAKTFLSFLEVSLASGS